VWPTLLQDDGRASADRRRQRARHLTDIRTGNAAADGAAFRGWFVGHFLGAEHGVASTEAVEVKWGEHSDGDARTAWTASDEATTLSILIRGRIRILYREGREALLSQAGDYALWGPGVAHRWRIEQDDTVVLTLRWPSKPGDTLDLEP
jgi:hypothetical protein